MFECTEGLSVLESSKDWSSNLDKSIKQTLSANNYTQFQTSNPPLTSTYTASVTVHSTSPGQIIFLARDTNSGTNTIVKKANFPSTDQTQLTLTITPNEFTGTETKLYIRTFHTEDSTIYSDDWRLLQS